MSVNDFEIDNAKSIPMLEYVFSLIDNSGSAEEAVSLLMEKCAQLFDLNMIVIKELDAKNNCIRCTYQWSSDGNNELLNVETRFNDESAEKWEEKWKSREGIYRFYIGEEELPSNMFDSNRIVSMLSIPLIRQGKIIGVVDYIDSLDRREWTEKEISSLKQINQILAIYLLYFRDVDALKEDSRHQLELDYLTKLPKYEYFLNELKSGIISLKGVNIVVASFDFSNFKMINEKYGYQEGNKIFSLFAKEIYELCDSVITSCRSYSDNFLICAKSAKNNSVNIVRRRIETAMAHFRNTLRETYFDCNLIINCGFTIITDFVDSLEVSIANANLARKHAKNQKTRTGYRCVQYDSWMSELKEREADFINSMERAIENEEFFVALQPRCITDTLEIIGAEALVRWRNKDENLLPEEFLPAFEHDGCIVNLDYYVYEKVFSYIAKREAEQLPLVPVSVNVSMVHFRSYDLVPFVSMLLDKYEISPSLVEFELSENIYLSNSVYIEETIKGLKKLGFSVFIHDFGAGYSSLNTLTKYPTDGIKIDRVFMKRQMEKKDKIIVSSIISMANKLNLQVVCEGVETEEQRLFLDESECPFIQGFYYSCAVSMDEFGKMLEEQENSKL